MLQLTPAEYERARTWNPEIAAKLSGSKPRSEGNEFRFPGHGGLSINSLTGAWIQHATGRGGYSAVGLVALLTDKPDEAIIWIKAWLAEHPGTGSCCTDANAGEEDGTPASAELARQALDDAIDITGTAGEVYLREHRRIDPPFPPDAKFVPNARCGEGAISALLYAHDRVVGVVVQYVRHPGWRKEPCRAPEATLRARKSGRCGLPDAL
jgi:hypothetical protein